ncbi:MAG: hypothetical protein ACI9XK_002780, partial [Granulosicoccus sp.]
MPDWLMHILKGLIVADGAQRINAPLVSLDPSGL